MTTTTNTSTRDVDLEESEYDRSAKMHDSQHYLASIQNARTPAECATFLRAFTLRMIAARILETSVTQLIDEARRAENDAQAIERCETMGDVFTILHMNHYLPRIHFEGGDVGGGDTVQD